MTENNKKEVPSAAKVCGRISLVISCLGMLGMLLIVIASVMPSYQGTSLMIHSEDAARAVVFFVGCAIGYLLPPLGGLLGIISLIIMLVDRRKKMIWLPIAGTAIGIIAFVGSILATVALM